MRFLRMIFTRRQHDPQRVFEEGRAELQLLAEGASCISAGDAGRVFEFFFKETNDLGDCAAQILLAPWLLSLIDESKYLEQASASTDDEAVVLKIEERTRLLRRCLDIGFKGAFAELRKTAIFQAVGKNTFNKAVAYVVMCSEEELKSFLKLHPVFIREEFDIYARHLSLLAPTETLRLRIALRRERLSVATRTEFNPMSTPISFWTSASRLEVFLLSPRFAPSEHGGVGANRQKHLCNFACCVGWRRCPGKSFPL